MKTNPETINSRNNATLLSLSKLPLSKMAMVATTATMIVANPVIASQAPKAFENTPKAEACIAKINKNALVLVGTQYPTKTVISAEVAQVSKQAFTISAVLANEVDKIEYAKVEVVMSQVFKAEKCKLSIVVPEETYSNGM